MELFKEQEKDELQTEVDSIKAGVNQTLKQFKSEQRFLFNRIWYNDKYTPQQIFDKLGSLSVELFIASGKAEAYLAEMEGEDYVSLKVPYEFTINEDGTVTVGDKIAEEQN